MPTWPGPTAKFSDGLRAAPGDDSLHRRDRAVRRLGERPGRLSGHALGARRPDRARAARRRAVGARARLRELPRAVLSRSRASRCTRRSATSRSSGRRSRATPGKAPIARCCTCSCSRCSRCGRSAARPPRCCSAAGRSRWPAWRCSWCCTSTPRRTCAALFSEGRLKYPGDYENASAATWLMAAWPALLLARTRTAALGAARAARRQRRAARRPGAAEPEPRLAVLDARDARADLRAAAGAPAHVRRARAGGDRRRRATAPAVLRVGDRLLHGGDAPAAMHAATAAIFIAALAVAAVVAVAAALESRATLSDARRARLRRGVAAVAIGDARRCARRRRGSPRATRSSASNTAGTRSRAATPPTARPAAG